MRIALLPNPRKPDALAAAQELLTLLRPRATPLILPDGDLAALRQAAPDLIVVLGGDGSLLHVASAVAEVGAPVVGINFGKLGYLAAFSLEEFRQHLDSILAGKLAVSERLMLEAALYRTDHPAGPAQDQALDALLTQQPPFRFHALNDIVVNAGEPFRMIELHLRINGEDTTTFRGDGVIVSTASGSTGYNLSAGGPLMSPEVPAFVVTPICAHSLSFRPVVIPDTSTVLIHAHRVNPGTKVNFDGQLVQPLGDNEGVLIRRAPTRLKLVENPAMSHWRMLASKLQWAQNPRQR